MKGFTKRRVLSLTAPLIRCGLYFGAVGTQHPTKGCLNDKDFGEW